MTREDARHYLQSSGFSEEHIATIEQAFKQEPSSDLIRRTDLLDMVEDMTDQFGIKHRVITEGIISLLPSVNSQSCEDVISRQAVLDYIYNDLGLGDEENGKDVERQMELESSYKYVNSLSSVKPQEPYKGMTNGQVHDMLYQMLVELKDGEDRYGAEKWWNSPYEPQESEDKR